MLEMANLQFLVFFCGFLGGSLTLSMHNIVIRGLNYSIPDFLNKKASNPAIEQKDMQKLLQQAAEIKEKLDYDKFLPFIQIQLKSTLKSSTKEPEYSPVIRNGHVCCYNGGTCHLGINFAVRRCSCPLGFTGYQCDDDIDECLDPQICKNNEICINNYGSFTCTCPKYFVREGADCIPATTCEEYPCLNGAQCIDSDDGHFKCFCPLGFMGTSCQQKIAECEDSSCASDETCVSTQHGFRCTKGEKD